MAIFIIFMIIAFFIGIAFYFEDGSVFKKNKLKKEKMETLINSNDFISTKYYVSKNNNSAIEINEDKKQIRLSYEVDNENLIESKVYNFKDILESEIIIDNNSIIKSSRVSQLGGALIGGALAGGVGAIIGGLSGEKRNLEYIKNIDLAIKVDDIDTPLFKINFLSNITNNGVENKMGFKKTSKEVKEAINDIDYWYNVLNVIINRESKEVAK